MISLALVFMIQVALELPEGVEHRPGISHGDPEDYGDDFDWESRDAIAFLEVLKSRSHYTVVAIHDDWVRRQDLPKLIELLDSTERCAAVKMSISSLMTFDASTVGNEAAFLIRGYMDGRYPPGLNSNRRVATDEDKDRLRKWWVSESAE